MMYSGGESSELPAASMLFSYSALNNHSHHFGDGFGDQFGGGGAFAGGGGAFASHPSNNDAAPSHPASTAPPFPTHANAMPARRQRKSQSKEVIKVDMHSIFTPGTFL